MATLLLGLILTACLGLRVTDGQALGFVLGGTNYPDSSTVLRSDIGEVAAGLQCTTDSTTCCTGAGRAGEFYFPNGDQVPIMAGTPSNSYYRDRGTGFIRLNRRPTAMETGQFRCQIPDASGTLVNLFINIENELPTIPSTLPSPNTLPNPTTPPAVSISIYITTSGTNTAGETYSLECAATVTGSTDQPTITWLNPMSNPVPSEMVTTTGSMSTLTFNPLAASHAGIYTCGAVVGSAVRNKAVDLIVQIPGSAATISIFSNPTGTIIAGSNVTLTCTVQLSSAVDVPVTVSIQLTDPAENQLTTATALVSGLTYTSSANKTIVSSDQAGVYTCRATIRSTSRFLTTGSLQAETTTISVVLPPPLNVQATQSSASSPVEVSWRPPSGGAATITSYRIFYGNGENVSVPVFVRLLGSIIKAQNTQKISIRSESTNFISELINVTIVTMSLNSANDPNTANGCTTNDNAAAIALGVVIILVVLITVVVVAVLVFVILKLRQQQAVAKPVEMSKQLQDLSFSSNIAYGQVKVESTAPDVYEDLSGCGAPLYATAEEDDIQTHQKT